MFDVIHQWIRLNELYKLMDSFFSNFESYFSNQLKNFQIIMELGINASVEGASKCNLAIEMSS